MEDVWNDFRRALSDAERKGIVPVKQERIETELDRAVSHYKQEKKKQERIARFLAY